MKRLASLQREFQRHIYRPGPGMARAVRSATRAVADRRLAVYADGYRARLVGALATDYPALQGLMGAPAFERMLREFVAAQPSRHANLRWYGGELAGFLARAPHWGRRPLLAELARFEWALGLAFDAADAPLATAEQVARIPVAHWPAMRLQLHPSVQRLSLRTGAPQAWSKAILGRASTAVGSRRGKLPWLLWRKEHEPFFRVLSRAEAWALGAAARGRDFAFLSSGLRRFVGAERAAQAGAQLLRNWLAEGLICAVNR